MTRRRIAPPAGHRASTKGHSVLKKWAYGKSGGVVPEYDDVHVDRYVPTFIPRHLYDTGREERQIHRGVDREIIISDHLMDDAYDTARKSHNKDAALLREASAAVPPSKRSKSRRFDEDNTLNDITLRRFKSTYVPYQKRCKKSSYQPPTDANDGITTRHLKATTTSKHRGTTFTPLGTLASREWTSSKPSRKSYQEMTTKHPPDYYDHLIESIPSFTRAIGNIEVSPDASLTGSPYGSPYATPRESPERELRYGNQETPLKKQRSKVMALRSKHNVGSYYRRLLQKRARNPERKSKYWPYYDVESVGNSDTAGLFSDEEYEDAYESYPAYNDNDSYPREEYHDTYPRDEYHDGTGDSYYVYDGARSQSPEEYVPFVPRRHNYDDDEEYKCALPDLPDLAVVPYIPSHRNGGSGISEDMAFHNIVAQTASKARKALRNINLNEYDNASLVLSVEGQYTHPERGDVLGFQYIARPLPLKCENLATGPGYAAATSSDTSTFCKYLNTMRDFREGIRQRLESGYAALRDVSRTVPSYSSYRPIEPQSSSSFKYSYPSITSYRKELEDGFGGTISLYPLSSRGKTELALPSAASEAVPDHTHKVELFDSKPDVKLSTLDKIKIKVSSETHANPRAAVAARRAARGHTYYPEPLHYIPQPLPPLPPQPTPPPRTNYPSRRLEKEVVVLVNPYRLRPASVSRYNARVFLTKAAMAGRVALKDYPPPPVTRTDLDRSIQDLEKRAVVIHTLGRPVMLPLYRPYVSLYPWSHPLSLRYPFFDFSRRTTRVRVLASPLPQKRKKSLSRKAALVGSKVDVVLPSGKRRRPRSQYAQKVMREIDIAEVAKDDDDISDEVLHKQQKPRSSSVLNSGKSVSFRRYPTTFVPDMTPSMKDVKTRLKSLLKTYKISSSTKENAPPSSVVKNYSMYPKSSKSGINFGSTSVKDIKTNVNSSKEEVSSAGVTSSLRAHPRVPQVGRRGGKAIRDIDGQFTKPKNLLSWKYRLEARTSPGDYFYTPRTFANMRDQIRGVKDKMDRHRQLMDRYLDSADTGREDVRTNILAKSSETRSLGNSGPSTTRSSLEGDANLKTTPVRPTSARMPRIPLEIPKLPKRRRFLKSRQN